MTFMGTHNYYPASIFQYYIVNTSFLFPYHHKQNAKYPEIATTLRINGHVTINRETVYSLLMSSIPGKAEQTAMLDVLIPLAFRNCVKDLSTEQLTKSEKSNIEKFVYRWVETYSRTRERTAEQALLEDYRDFLDH